jgi:hypothetical protein
MTTALKTELFQARLTPMDMNMLRVLASDQQLHPAEWFRILIRQEFEKRKK